MPSAIVLQQRLQSDIIARSEPTTAFAPHAVAYMVQIRQRGLASLFVVDESEADSTAALAACSAMLLPAFLLLPSPVR